MPFLGVLPQISRNALRFFMRVLRAHDRVELRFLGRRVVLLCHPADIEAVLVRDRDAYGRSLEVRKLRPLFGDGLLASDGDLWRRQRTAIAPNFKHDALRVYAGIMHATIDRVLDGWTQDEDREVHAEMMRYTRETICSVLFGERFTRETPELGQAVTTVFGDLRSEILYLPLWRRLPTRRSRAWNRAAALIERTVDATIRERASSAPDAERSDLLDALLSARDPHGNAMPHAQIRDEIMTLFLAGHETAAVTLTWACHLLARDPEAQARIRAEVLSVTNGRGLAATDHADLRFTAAVVKETLRLYPPVWSVGREVVSPTVLGGRPIAAGTDVWICLYRTHRDARWFRDADRFLPDRWLEDGPPAPYTYLPFGMGPRVCIGQHFATIESVIALAAICSRFVLEPADAAPIEPSAWITLRPSRPVVVRVRPHGAPAPLACSDQFATD